MMKQEELKDHIDEYDEYAYEILEDYVTDAVGSYEIYQELYMETRKRLGERLMSYDSEHYYAVQTFLDDDELCKIWNIIEIAMNRRL